ncbi:hypothetical protein [Gaoshiqia sp. Z1-71]|uniref:hypothetical protein n=1 Tax=Gaoshiqia hydrogeniformans TaxID=3290090 RepID=UPI003BF8DFD2
MKTISRILVVLAVLFLTACEGEQGPPGMDGLNGDDLVGTVFEIQGTFNAQNNYTLYYQFPNNFEIYDSDIVLVYILWDQVDNLDVWRLLPQTVVLPEGVLLYNFDYTVGDVQVFLECTFDYSLLLPSETNNQVFRIAVLPAAYASNKAIDLTNLDAVMKSLKIDSSSVEKLNLSR